MRRKRSLFETEGGSLKNAIVRGVFMFPSKLYCSQAEKGLNSSSLFNNQIWRIEDVAGCLRCSTGHVYNLVSKRRIPFRKKGGLLLFIPSEIFNWINEGEI